jgi:hypothetical protein
VTIIDVGATIDDSPSGTAYCSIDQARSAGALGTDDEVLAAIVQASLRVERFTSDLFAPQLRTLRRKVDDDGIVRVRKRVSSISSVTFEGASTPLAVESYSVRSSSDDGFPDQIVLGGLQAWSDVTVNGAEPWNGGWVGLAQRFGASRDPYVTVVGEFGWSSPPLDVQQVTAARSNL